MRFLKRGRGVVDAYVGDVLVGSLFRVRSPSTVGTSWTARPIGSASVFDLTLAEAKVVLRLSDRARALQSRLYPDPERSAAPLASAASEGQPLRLRADYEASGEPSEEESAYDLFGPPTPA